MNKGAFHSSLVQQMMASGSPSCWNLNNMRPPPHDQQQAFPTILPSTTSTSTMFPHDHHQYSQPNWQEDSCQEFPESWSQLLLGGIVGEEDKYGVATTPTNSFLAKKLESWEDQLVHSGCAPSNITDQLKQEYCGSGYQNNLQSRRSGSEEINASKSPWNQILLANSSPKSCVTTISSNMLDFSNKSETRQHQSADHNSSESNSTATGSASKKARVQGSTSSQSTFKVRKEKLGDRITALHQLVSPFGKTDTASVLLEAIGYIRFLQSQIQALSSPYMGTGGGAVNKRQLAQGEMTSLFPDDPGQLLNTSGMNTRGPQNQKESNDEPKKDLRSRGLCLVPVSFTMHVGSENGADYWAPAFGGGF